MQLTRKKNHEVKEVIKSLFLNSEIQLMWSTLKFSFSNQNFILLDLLEKYQVFA